MAGKSDAPVDDPEIIQAAREIVERRRRNLKYDAAPYWRCSECDFSNHPRKGYPNDKCEQCGHNRTDADRTIEPR